MIDTDCDCNDENEFKGEVYCEDDNSNDNDNYQYYYDRKNYNNEKCEDGDNIKRKNNYINFEDYEKSMNNFDNNAALNLIDEVIF